MVTLFANIRLDPIHIRWKNEKNIFAQIKSSLTIKHLLLIF